jgi:hypothetical protein
LWDRALFAQVFFPHYCTDPFNEFHKAIFDAHDPFKRGRREAWGAPRGYAKSVHKAVIGPLHDIAYNLERFIVIISNTDSQANDKLRDIRAEILENTLFTSFYGITFPSGKPAETEYVVLVPNGAIKLQGFGARSEIRGLRFGTARPSKIIFDDLEHSDEVESEALRTKLENRDKDVYSKLGDPRTNFEFIGTILHRQSLLKSKLSNPMWKGQVFKSVISWSEREDLWEKWRDILRDKENPHREAEAQAFYDQNEAEMLRGTRVLWPERESYLYLMKELLETGRRSFFKEKQNDPMGNEEKIFFPDQFLWYREEERDIQGTRTKGFFIEKTGRFIPMSDLDESVAALDPATGQRKPNSKRKPDFTALLSGYTRNIGERDTRTGAPRQLLFVHNAWLRRGAPSEWIRKIFEHYALFGYTRIGIETNLYRNLLMPNVAAEKLRWEKETRQKARFRAYEIETVENKEKRIYSVEPMVSNGLILFNRALHQDFISQLEDFPFGDHDDGPDALEMLWSLANNRYTMNEINLDALGAR